MEYHLTSIDTWWRFAIEAQVLCHIHKLGIAHGDIRIDNVLFDNRASTIPYGFSAACPFGQLDLVISELPLLVNGPSPNLSEATDMFAMSALLFEYFLNLA
jgi:serine/threonine protein kinase